MNLIIFDPPKLGTEPMLDVMTVLHTMMESGLSPVNDDACYYYHDNHHKRSNGKDDNILILDLYWCGCCFLVNRVSN